MQHAFYNSKVYNVLSKLWNRAFGQRAFLPELWRKKDMKADCNTFREHHTSAGYGDFSGSVFDGFKRFDV